MKKSDLQSLIYDLTRKKEKLEEDCRELRDQMYEAQGSCGELQLLIWKLEKYDGGDK